MAAETESTCSQATEHQQAGTPIIETASATTSADNANSGSKPYVIAAVGLDYDDGDVYERLEELVREDDRLGSGYGSGTLSTSSLS